MQLARPLPSCEYSPGPQTSIQRNNMIKSLHRAKVKVGPHTILTIIYPSHILLLLMNGGNLPSLNVSIQVNSLSSLRLSIQTSVLAKTIRGGLQLNNFFTYQTRYIILSLPQIVAYKNDINDKTCLSNSLASHHKNINHTYTIQNNGNSEKFHYFVLYQIT